MIDNLGKSGGLGGERKTEYKIQETSPGAGKREDGMGDSAKGPPLADDRGNQESRGSGNLGISGPPRADLRCASTSLCCDFEIEGG